MPISEDQAFLVTRSTAYDRDGLRIGAVMGIYSDNHTGRPEWVTVSEESTGSVRFAPLASASYARGRLLLDVTRAQVLAAPVTSHGDDLDGRAETVLYTHYGLSPAGDTDVDPASRTTPRAESDSGEHSLLPPAER
ncbi:hypothetical protein [Cellulomonas aerilata]|uniref:PRC-barrel domain-containing protein n=1 Tax=Cellulomonas aerilata TaxID=515326 RepID=A0A512D754_9CELL|nr:hypothetical protein [Cellulomonas aerilata]GEO32314.1 hypothetical protein CAE01nite_00390 [Cellulomonas aerilata]